MTAEQTELLNNLFSRYGRPSNEIEIIIRDYIVKADSIDELSRIEYYDTSTKKTIEQLESTIQALQIYRLSLFERYNLLSTSPKQLLIKLKREKSYSESKVYYFLIEIEKNLTTGNEVITKTTKYSGSNRKQAFEDYESYIKSHPGITAIKETEKGKFER